MEIVNVALNQTERNVHQISIVVHEQVNVVLLLYDGIQTQHNVV